MTLRAYLAMIMGVLVSAWPLMAQQPLTLEQAQSEARRQAPETGALDASVSGAQSIAAQAGRMFRNDPQLSASYAPGALAAQSEEWSWTVGLQWTVDLSRSWVPRAQSAEADVARAERARDDGLRALDERVAAAYADVAFGQEWLARSQRLRALQALVASAEHHRLDVGDGTQLETDAADLDLVTARVEEEQARADLTAARLGLARLLGRRDGSDLIVADTPEPAAPASPLADLDTIVARDPRVRGAKAELEAAQFEQELDRRLRRPAPTFGVEAGSRRTDIPVGAFGAAAPTGLSALWTDRDVTFNFGIPLPLFDRQREPLARASARILAAESQFRLTTADVRQELQQSWETLQATGRIWQVLSQTQALVDRDATFLEQAVRAGEFSSVTQAQALHRLDDVGRRADEALRAFRVARAAWARRTAGLQPPP